MKVILNNVQVKAVASWLPKNILEMVSLGAEYGDTEVANIMKATGVERARIADKTCVLLTCARRQLKR